ncbi:ketohexokinase [Drosophila eugracilis]|uniref:ketohexokinase n=1 Tax=Drosophila eugracilis TaxID=29029 RepID=UPI0007E65EE9|nr:ketohexokinase [Drosophila eugracilis]
MTQWCSISVMKAVLCVGCTEVDYVTTIEKADFQKDTSRTQNGYLQRSGRSSNVSTALRLLGANVELFGVLTRNPTYRMIMDDLEKRGIDISHCTFTDQCPPFSTIVQERWTRRCTVVYCDKAFPYVTAADFRKLDLNQYGWVNFEARSPRETCEMIRLILDHNNGKDEDDRIVISLQIYNAFEQVIDLIGMCDYVFVTKYIAESQGWMTPLKACEGINSLLRMPRAIRIRRPCVIAPWSSLGAGCMTADGQYFELPAHKAKKIVDRVGDSDCFTAAFIYAAFVRQRRLANAVDFANAVACYKLGYVGFDCLRQFQIDPVKLPDKIKAESEVSSDDEDEGNDQQNNCRKYLFRPSEFLEVDALSIATNEQEVVLAPVERGSSS